MRTTLYVLSSTTDRFTEPPRIVAQAFERTKSMRLEDFALIERDRLIGSSLDMQSYEAPAIIDANGTSLITIEIRPQPGRNGAVQTVAFAQDGNYFVTISFSAATSELHRKFMPAFARFVAAYHADRLSTAQ